MLSNLPTKILKQKVYKSFLNFHKHFFYYFKRNNHSYFSDYCIFVKNVIKQRKILVENDLNIYSVEFLNIFYNLHFL